MDHEQTSTSKKHVDYVHGLILKIAAAANVKLPEASQSVYLERLQKLTRDEITTAVALTIEEWKEASKMPPLGFILERKGGDAKLIAEQAWELVSRLIRRDWYADGIGWSNGAQKKLTAAMQYGIRTCGGESRMAYADEDAFPFIRRDFLQAHERFTAEDGQQVRLTHAEAAGFLDKLRNTTITDGTL